MAPHNGEPPAPRGDWFSKLFGFAETDYHEARNWLRADRGKPRGPVTLESLATGARYSVGLFETPSLAELRDKGAAAKLPGRIAVSNELGDVAAKHALTENRYATFQVASQFNCLEFVGPSVVPEDGITKYASDRTQGPACSIACGAATAYRNYFAPVAGREGQTRHHQVDNLADLSAALGNVPCGKLFDVRGGYTLAKDSQLALLNSVLSRFQKEGKLEELHTLLRVGVHTDVQVTSTNWGRNRVYDPEQQVTQVFGSACSVAYNAGRSESWRPFATLVLQASYEATLWAALLNAVRHRGRAGSRRVFLTCLGGGVFGNSMDWIMQAMRQAIVRFADHGLDVRVVTYAGNIDPRLLALEQEFAVAHHATPARCPASAEAACPVPEGRGTKRCAVEELSPEKTNEPKELSPDKTNGPKEELSPEKTNGAKEADDPQLDELGGGAAAAKRTTTSTILAGLRATTPQVAAAAAVPGASRPARGAKAAKPGKPEALEIERGVLDEAYKLGYENILKTLVNHPQVIDAGVTHKLALNALKASGGLLHPARRALLAGSRSA